ncbi:MAG: hypothetical protein AB2A00_02935 [Myxococcota bacterium]
MLDTAPPDVLLAEVALDVPLLADDVLDTAPPDVLLAEDAPDAPLLVDVVPDAPPEEDVPVAPDDVATDAELELEDEVALLEVAELPPEELDELPLPATEDDDELALPLEEAWDDDELDIPPELLADDDEDVVLLDCVSPVEEAVHDVTSASRVAGRTNLRGEAMDVISVPHFLPTMARGASHLAVAVHLV